MKKILLTLALIATTVGAFAQGKVSLGNDSTRLFEFGNFPPPGPIPQSPLPSGQSVVVALYAGTSASTLFLQTSFSLTGTSWLAPGRMATKLVVLSFPGGAIQNFGIALVSDNATLPGTVDGNQLTRNPDTVTLTSGASLFSNTDFYGSSGLFTAVPGTSITFPLLYQPTPPVNSTWQTGPVYINAVPEPSCLALAGLSTGMLLLFRRRK